MDFKEVVQSDEWRKVYKELLHRHRHYSFTRAKSWEEYLQNRAKVDMIEEILKFPLDKMPKDDADNYRSKIDRDIEKYHKEIFRDIDKYHKEIFER